MAPLVQPLLSTTLPCWVIGHRGAAAVCRENTIASFSVARDAGAYMVELDVQQSADGELFVFHDDTLERLCGERTSVASLMWEALSGKSVGYWREQPLKIPRLAEVFTALQRSVCYNVELKTDAVAYAGIEARLVDLVHDHNLTERVLVSSFRPDSLRAVHEKDPRISLGLLLSLEHGQHLGSPEAVITQAQEFSCFSVHPHFRLLRQWPSLVKICHAARLRVFPWTVDNPQDWQFLVTDTQVDGVITNDPGKLYEWLLTTRSSSSRSASLS
jgi:glycerophosphoryl diester phosphodiesterase